MPQVLLFCLEVFIFKFTQPFKRRKWLEPLCLQEMVMQGDTFSLLLCPFPDPSHITVSTLPNSWLSVVQIHLYFP